MNITSKNSKAHGLNRLPRNAKTRTIKNFHRYEKQVPGHYVQVDVKFLKLHNRKGRNQSLSSKENGAVKVELLVGFAPA